MSCARAPGLFASYRLPFSSSSVSFCFSSYFFASLVQKCVELLSPQCHLSFPPASAPPPSSSRAHSIRGVSTSLAFSHNVLSLLFLLPRLGALLLSLPLSIYVTYSSLLLVFLWVQSLLRMLLFSVLAYVV